MSTHESCWIVCKMIFANTRIVRAYCMHIQVRNAVQWSFHRHARMRTRICTVSIFQSMPFIIHSDCCQRKKKPLNLCCKWQNQSHTFNELSFIFIFNIQQDPFIRITAKKRNLKHCTVKFIKSTDNKSCLSMYASDLYNARNSEKNFP